MWVTMQFSKYRFMGSQVEGEMQQVVASVELRRKASAAKMKQLATVLQDLQGPYLAGCA